MRFDAEEYYDNQAFNLSEEQQRNLLQYMNGIQEQANNALHKHYELNETSLATAKTRLISFSCLTAMLDGIRQGLEVLGILVAYDWEGCHREKWFFPTYEDALMHEDWLFSVRD